MAYDAKDPDTIKAVKAAVDAALEEAAEEHESDKAGLVKKNGDLIARLKKAREGKADLESVEKLEADLETAKSELAAAKKTITKAEKDRDAFKAAADTEAAAAKRLVCEGSLTNELVAAGVKKEFMPAVQKLLADKVEQTIDGDKRSATVAGKPLSEFVKAWSQSDEGKIYVTAPANGGGNAPGGSANTGKTKTIIAKADYEANPTAYAGALRSGEAAIAP